MSMTALFAAALFVPAPATVPGGEPNVDRVEVAYEQLAKGENRQAVERILGSGPAASRDPATLINLGTVYARTGRLDDARQAYRAAVALRDRYDLELSNGRWMDSRAAARMALASVEETTVGGPMFALGTR